MEVKPHRLELSQLISCEVLLQYRARRICQTSVTVVLLQQVVPSGSAACVPQKAVYCMFNKLFCQFFNQHMNEWFL